MGGHSSYTTWLLYKFRAVERILPALKGKSKYGWVAPVLIVLLIMLASIGMGIYADGYGIHPPQQFTGVCPPPAQITHGGCYLTEIETITVNGQVTQTTILVPAGQIVYASQTGR